MKFAHGLILGVIGGILLGLAVSSYVPLSVINIEPTSTVTALTKPVEWGEDGAYVIYRVHGMALLVPTTAGGTGWRHRLIWRWLKRKSRL